MIVFCSNNKLSLNIVIKILQQEREKSLKYSLICLLQICLVYGMLKNRNLIELTQHYVSYTCTSNYTQC